MSHWAGYYGQGMALTKKEFETFLENYKSGCTDEESLRQLKAVEKEEEWIEDVKFMSESGKEHYVTYVDDGNTEGFRLIPYRMKGIVNKDWEAADMPQNNVYVFPSDKAVDGMTCFDEKVYGSYDEFVQEFKDKLGAYLPGDFDWDAHIGIYTYACFG